MKHETRYALGFNKYNEPIDPEIKINMFDKSKVKKSSKLIGQKYFEVITQNNIFLVASMEVKSQLDTLHSFLGFFFFFYLGFLSRTFTNYRTAAEAGGHFFNFSLPLSPSSRSLRH